MDWALLGVALAISGSFILLVWARRSQRQRQNTQVLEQLMRRVGVNFSQVQAEMKETRDFASMAWVQRGETWLKKAGLSDKKVQLHLVYIQAGLLFFSTLVWVAKYHSLPTEHLVMVTLLPLLPIAYVFLKTHQRQKELRQQFPEMLDAIVRSLHSGYGIDGAIGAVGEDLRGPLAEEMREVNKQLTLGISMRDVLREFQRRVALPEAQFFVITLIIQRETGGQLAAILSELSKLMRRRDNFQSKLKTLTAESRFTAWFIGGAPILFIVYKYVFDRESMHFFLHDPLGFKLFMYSLVMIALGTLILRYMLKMRF